MDFPETSDFEPLVPETPVSDDFEVGKDLNDLITETQIGNELHNLQDTLPYTLVDPEYYKEIQAIDKEHENSEEKNFMDSFGEVLKDKGTVAAVLFLFEHITKIFSGTKNNRNSPKEQIDYDETIDELLEGCPPDEEVNKLNGLLGQYEQLMNNVSSTQSKVKLCLRISRLKNELLARRLGKNELTQKDTLENNLEVGDVLVFNLRKKTNSLQESFKTNAIITMVQQGTGNSVATHTAIVTNQNPTEITHSTSDKGVHSTPLIPYLSSMESGEFISMRPTQGISGALDFVQSAMGKEYDAKGALRDGTSKQRNSIDDAYYCSELLAEAYGMSVDVNTPEELLDVFPMSYYHELG